MKANGLAYYFHAMICQYKTERLILQSIPTIVKEKCLDGTLGDKMKSLTDSLNRRQY